MQFDFNLGANQSTTLEVAGKFFKYKSGTGVIRVRATKGGYVDLLPGQGVWNIEFTSLTVMDKSGAANAGVILAGWFDFHDDRIAGTVDVVDGGKARTLANQAFLGRTGQAATAAVLSHAQLKNPAASTVRTIVKKIGINCSAGTQVVVATYDPDLTTSGGAAASKLSGGASSQTGLRFQTNAAALQTLPYIYGEVQGALFTEFKMEEPIILLPGRGIVVVCASVNVTLNCFFDFIEEAI